MHNVKSNQAQLQAELEALKAKVAELQPQKMETEARFAKSQELLYQFPKLEAVGWLAGGIIHDFNNLLTVILTYSGFVLNALRAEDPLWADVAQIEQAASTASEMARQFLSFSRNSKTEPEILDLNAVIMKVEKLLRQVVGETVSLAISYHPQACWLKANSIQLIQLLLNLVVNARDAMPQGGSLLIQTSCVQLDELYTHQHKGMKPGEYICLSVTDTGCGIDPAILPRIFTPFFTNKAPGAGSGLGLATVDRTVKESGGSIEVYSQVGRGTTFKIYFPQLILQEASSEPGKEPRLEGTVPQSLDELVFQPASTFNLLV